MTTTVEKLIDEGLIAIGDGYRAKNNELSQTGLPFARAGNINQGFKFDDADHFPLERISTVGEKISRSGDVVFTSKGTVGRFAFVRPDTQPFVYSPQLCYWRSLKPEKVLPRFLYYWMQSPEFINQIAYLKGQTDMADYVSLRDQRKIKITIPDVATQQTIVDIVGSIDDKIELNRKMNRTLEQMAQALFKAWFVDFEPVKAKAAGRTPESCDAETAALFPDEFVDSESDAIPKGWRVDAIRSRTSNIQYGLTQSASTTQIGPHFLRITDIQAGRVDWNRVPFCRVTSSEHERYRIVSGDILVARTGASTGENIYVIDPPDAVFASYLVRLQFADPSIASLVGVFMRTAIYFEYIKGTLGGSAQPNANAQVLASASLVFPTKEVAERFSEAVRPLHKNIVRNTRESNTLASLRDSLLPKLISGQLRIPDAEALAEAVV